MRALSERIDVCSQPEFMIFPANWNTTVFRCNRSGDHDVGVVEREGVRQLDVHAVEALSADLRLVPDLSVEYSRQVEASEVPDGVE